MKNYLSKLCQFTHFDFILFLLDKAVKEITISDQAHVRW